MARVLILAVLCIAVAFGQEDCICKDTSDEEMKAVWNFFKTLNDSDEDSVLPGLLSPLAPCGNCLDIARRKRTVLPSVADANIEVTPSVTPNTISGWECPVGYARIGFRCVDVEALYE